MLIGGNNHGNTYIVQSGDTFSKIAKTNNLTLDELKNLNPQISNYNKITIGDRIVIKAPKTVEKSENKVEEESKKESEENDITQINEDGIIVHQYGVTLRDTLDDSKEGIHLAQKTHVNILTKVATGTKQFYKVQTDDGKVGYITAMEGYAKRNPLNIKLHIVESGESLLAISLQYYGGKSNMEADHNHFVDALVEYNKDIESKDKIKAGEKVWIPPYSILKGYIKLTALDKLEGGIGRIVEFVMVFGSFVKGVVFGATKSIVDVFTGLIDLIKSIFNGTLISGIIDTIKTIFTTHWIDVLSNAGKELIKQWNGMSNPEKGLFIGKIVGYLGMEILMAVISGGASMALKGAILTSKLAKTIKGMSIIKSVVNSKLVANIPKKDKDLMGKAIEDKNNSKIELDKKQDNAKEKNKVEIDSRLEVKITDLKRTKENYNKIVLENKEHPSKNKLFSKNGIGIGNNLNLLVSVKIPNSGKWSYYRTLGNKTISQSKDIRKKIKDKLLEEGDELIIDGTKNPSVKKSNGDIIKYVWHHSPNNIQTIDLIKESIHRSNKKDLHDINSKGGNALYNTMYKGKKNAKTL
jgi:LysM repeat protein